MVVYPKAGQDVEALAIQLKANVPGIATMTGKDFDKQIGGATSILNSILVGIALISLLVGGLSVVNTMAMSIAERTREIGIKRAIGGSRRGSSASSSSRPPDRVHRRRGRAHPRALVVTVVNEAGRASGTVLFELTAGTALTAVGFSTILGASPASSRPSTPPGSTPSRRSATNDRHDRAPREIDHEPARRPGPAQVLQAREHNEVEALRGVESASPRARWWRSWARPGPARARSCTSSACSTPPTPTTARRPSSPSMAATWPPSATATGRGSGPARWGLSSRTSTSSRR